MEMSAMVVTGGFPFVKGRDREVYTSELVGLVIDSMS